jgi:hypothetical protein
LNSWLLFSCTPERLFRKFVSKFAEFPGMLERFFSLKEDQTSVLQEVVAGLTTFAAMTYILAVNPSIFSTTGMDKGALISPSPLWPLL